MSLAKWRSSECLYLRQFPGWFLRASPESSVQTRQNVRLRLLGSTRAQELRLCQERSMTTFRPNKLIWVDKPTGSNQTWWLFHPTSWDAGWTCASKRLQGPTLVVEAVPSTVAVVPVCELDHDIGVWRWCLRKLKRRNRTPVVEGVVHCSSTRKVWYSNSMGTCFWHIRTVHWKSFALASGQKYTSVLLCPDRGNNWSIST